jgi:hypothetical protein
LKEKVEPAGMTAPFTARAAFAALSFCPSVLPTREVRKVAIITGRRYLQPQSVIIAKTAAKIVSNLKAISLTSEIVASGFTRMPEKFPEQRPMGCCKIKLSISMQRR